MFHSVGFGPDGKPIFRKNVAIQKRKLRMKVLRVRKKNKTKKDEETDSKIPCSVFLLSFLLALRF